MGLKLPPRSKQPPTITARQAQRRKITFLRKKAERDLEALRNQAPNTAILRSPKVIIGAIIVLVVVGAALISQTNRSLSADNARVISISRAQKNVNALAVALAQFHYNTGRWPRNDEGLKALVDNPGIEGWAGPYIRILRPDIWDVPYGYRAPNIEAGETHPVVFSCGADRCAFTADDVSAQSSYYNLKAHDPDLFWTNRQETVERIRERAGRPKRRPVAYKLKQPTGADE